MARKGGNGGNGGKERAKGGREGGGERGGREGGGERRGEQERGEVTWILSTGHELPGGGGAGAACVGAGEMAGQSTELVSLLMASPRGEERGQRSVGQPNTQDNSGPCEPATQR